MFSKSGSLYIKDIRAAFPEGTIVSSKLKSSISFDKMMKDLDTARIIYVGERHTRPADHDIQLKILKKLYEQNKNIIVGMEMFDRTYQPILDQWSAGKLDRQTFIEKVQWYANWRFDFNLYSRLLDYIKGHRIPLAALNIPQYIPGRIAAGGLDNLPEADKKCLPETINTSDAAHRAYVKKIFQLHHIRGYDNFEYFYAAQCVWEDAMAEAIAGHIDNRTMLVIAGNGHITNKFGIPNRAYARTKLPFRTIMPVAAGDRVKLDIADYIWITPYDGIMKHPD